jgi:uncharacterized protein (TIGR02757 family)
MNRISRQTLELIYSRYNRRELIHPDPLEFLFHYNDVADREIAGLIASSLAYGRVSQILKSVSGVLSEMGPSPARFLMKTGKLDLAGTFSAFKHRFTTGAELTDFLYSIGRLIREYGSLEKCFNAGYGSEAETVNEALSAFANMLKKNMAAGKSSLLPDPARGSACKRLHLFLRWMVRRDDVDPGGWDSVSPSKLIVPLDTHMYHFSTCHGFTVRKNADLTTALEITRGFRSICVEDPVKFDFSLTRFGIRHDMCWNDLDGILDEASVR